MHALFVNFALAISSGVTLGSNLPGLTAIPFHREIPAHALKTNLERQRERSAFRSAAATNSVPSRASIEETQSPKARRQASLARCYSPQAWKSRAAAEKTATTTESGAWSLRGTSAAKLSPNFNSTFEPARALDSVNTPFVSCWDIIYYGEIQLGSDLQPLQVILDTGSSDLWVFSSTCTNCPSGTNKYDHSGSTDYVADGTGFTIKYADGDHVGGSLSQDRLTWGGLAINNQVFAEISDAETFTITCVEDGLLGMAFDELASSKQITPFHQLMKHHLVDAGVFAFYLDDASGGVLTLGGTDPSHYSGDTLQWIPIAFPWYGFWELHLYHAIAVGGTATTTGSHTAIMDTGTTLIIGPTNDVRQLAGDVGADCWFLHGFLAQTLVQHECTDFSTYDEFYYALVPCAGGLASNGGTVADPPEIDFVFGTTNAAANTFRLNADQYSLPNEEDCGEGYFMDCAGTCVASSSEVAGWIGDGSCDNGRYGYFFNCPALGCDGGDCSASECTMGDPGEVCMFGIFSGEASDQYWIFGDVFLRTVYTAYDYENMKVGLAYSSVGAATDDGQSFTSPAPTGEPTVGPTMEPAPAPTHQPSLSAQSTPIPTLSRAEEASPAPSLAHATPLPTQDVPMTPSNSPTVEPTKDSILGNDDDDDAVKWALTLELTLRASGVAAAAKRAAVVAALQAVSSDFAAAEVVDYDVKTWDSDARRKQRARMLQDNESKEPALSEGNNNVANQKPETSSTKKTHVAPAQPSLSAQKHAEARQHDKALLSAGAKQRGAKRHLGSRTTTTATTTTTTTKTTTTKTTTTKTTTTKTKAAAEEEEEEEETAAAASSSSASSGGAASRMLVGTAVVEVSAAVLPSDLPTHASVSEWVAAVTSEVQAAIDDGSLDISLAQECSDCNFSAESVVVAVVTQAPSLSPTASENSTEDSSTSNSTAAIEALSAVLVVAIIVFFVVMKGCKKSADSGVSGSDSNNLAFGEDEPRSGRREAGEEGSSSGTVMGKAWRWMRTSQANFSSLADDWASSPASVATPAESRVIPSSSSLQQAELVPAREPASRVVARARKEATEQSFYEAGMQSFKSSGVEVELTDRSSIQGQPLPGKPTRPVPRLPGTGTASVGGSSAAEKAMYAAQREAFDLPSSISSPSRTSTTTRGGGGGLFGRSSRSSAAVTTELVDDTEANNPMHNNGEDDNIKLNGDGGGGDRSSNKEAGNCILVDEDEGQFVEQGPDAQRGAKSSLAWGSSANDGSASSSSHGGMEVDLSLASDDKASLVRKPSKGIALRASAYAGVGEGSSDDDEEEDVRLALPTSSRAAIRHEL